MVNFKNKYNSSDTQAEETAQLCMRRVKRKWLPGQGKPEHNPQKYLRSWKKRVYYYTSPPCFSRKQEAFLNMKKFTDFNIHEFFWKKSIRWPNLINYEMIHKKRNKTERSYGLKKRMLRTMNPLKSTTVVFHQNHRWE